MTLQFKYALYNSVTKIAIILIMGVFTAISVERLSLYHITTKLKEKRDRFIRDISHGKINELLLNDRLYQDYNILREEFIVLRHADKPAVPDRFVTEYRTVEGTRQEYRVLYHYLRKGRSMYLLEIGETVEGVNALERAIQTFTLVLLIAALALTLLLDVVFTGILLKPLYRIIDQKIRNTNDPVHYDYRPVKTTTRDFRQLDDSINGLMNKLSHLFITQRQFIANMSHEVLTPISLIRIRTENLLYAGNLPDEAENKLYANLNTLNRLKSLVNSLLLISKIENNQYLLDDRVNLEETIAEIVEELEDKISENQLTVLQQVNPFAFHGNRSLLHILLFNLIGNAVKYNKPAGYITVNGDRTGEFYIMKIRDTGVGMNEEDARKAFNRFEKLDSIAEESHGLGLAIVKSIANLHRISISIDTQKGIGTVFTLHFPLYN
ncbi:MAG: HAMP domain-containing histidine kinase [Mucilaginibacter polytrichastri]|nr:HAMP domain-containing histidine kinase [Mucilaginibacter polytrichastri]